jgi:hypothetical protein
MQIFEIKSEFPVVFYLRRTYLYSQFDFIMRLLGETECDGQTDVWLLYPICTKPYCVRIQMSDRVLQVALRQTLLCGYKTEANQVGIKLTSPLRDSSSCTLLVPAGGFYCGVFMLCFYHVFFLFFFLSWFHCTFMTLANKCHCVSPVSVFFIYFPKGAF